MKLTTLRPFIPSGRDFGEAKRFFRDLGFDIEWENDGYAGLRFGEVAFILQDFQHEEMQQNLMLQVGVDDLDEWWRHLQRSGVLEKYPGVKAQEPRDFPWGLREVHLIDPAGVCWHFAEV
jgi:uncharacterized glyoxalase superfamily protein PhnB